MKRLFTTILILISIILCIYLIHDILAPFLISAIITYIVHPLTKNKYFRLMPKELGSLIITLLFVSLICFILITIIPYFFQQFSLLLHKLPSYIIDIKQQFIPWATSFSQKINPQISNSIQHNLAKQTELFISKLSLIATNLINSGMSIINFFSTLALVPVILFYMLLEGDKAYNAIFNLIPRKYHHHLTELLNQIDYTLSNYVKGQLIVCLIQALYYGICLKIYGIDNGFIIGLLAGFATIIPYFGAFISAVVTIFIGYIHSPKIITVISILIIYIIGQTIESNFLAPKIIGKKVGLNPIWMIFAMMVGIHLFGFVGMFFAIPVAAIISVVIRYSLSNYHQSNLYLKSN